jgi:hypothetical protein
MECNAPKNAVLRDKHMKIHGSKCFVFSAPEAIFQNANVEVAESGAVLPIY